MSDIDFDSDGALFASVCVATEAIRAAGGLYQIVLPDGHILAYADHPFAGKHGDELSGALEGVRGIWQARQAAAEAKIRAEGRSAAQPEQPDANDQTVPIASDEELLAGVGSVSKRGVPSVDRTTTSSPTAPGAGEARAVDPAAYARQQVSTWMERVRRTQEAFTYSGKEWQDATTSLAKWLQIRDLLEADDVEDQGV